MTVKMARMLLAALMLLSFLSGALAEGGMPVPAKPDLAALPVPPENLPRILSVELEDGRAVVTLDKGLYVNYGCFAPDDTGTALVIRADLEDGGWAFAEGREISPASEAEDVWVWAVPEGTEAVEAWLRYAALDVWVYEGDGDGWWCVSFEEAGLQAEWVVEEGAFLHAGYMDGEGHLLYDFDYEPGTNLIEFVQCPLGPGRWAIFDGGGAILRAVYDDEAGSWTWTPEEGWLGPDDEPVADGAALERLGDPSLWACPVDLNAPPRESGWYSL